jgi:hypothetical protein
MEDAEREWGNDEVLATFFVFFFGPPRQISVFYMFRGPPHP